MPSRLYVIYTIFCATIKRVQNATWIISNGNILNFLGKNKTFSEIGGFQVGGGTSRKTWSHYSSFHELFLSINLCWGVTRDPVQQHTGESPLEQDGNSLDEVAHLLTLLLTSVAS